MQSAIVRSCDLPRAPVSLLSPVSAARHRFLVRYFELRYITLHQILYTPRILIYRRLYKGIRTVIYYLSTSTLVYCFCIAMKRDRETSLFITYINPLVCSHVHMFIHGAIYTGTGSRAKLKFKIHNSQSPSNTKLIH